MKEDQITALAREYAEEECAKSTMIDTSNLYEDKLLEFYDVYSFLLRRFCLVEKGKLEEEYHEAKFTCGNVDPCSEAFVSSLAQKNLLERLFPEIAKEVEG